MKNFPLFFCFVLIFAFTASAQMNQSASCPNISVSSDGSSQPGEPMTFTANVKNYDLTALSFDWSITTGEIIEGQGTSTITVLKKKDNRQYLTARVEVKGLPEGCGNTAAETEPICTCIVLAILVDEFSIPAAQIDKEKLDALIAKLADEPLAQVYIIEYFKKNTSQKVINQKIKKTIDYLVNERRFEKDRITFLTAFDDSRNYTKFWIVPPGAEVPTP